MMLTTGMKAIYPCHGPCRVGPVVSKVVDGRAIMFYHLTVLDGNGGDLFVPVARAESIGVRSLLKKSQVPKLFDQLRKTSQIADNWKQRSVENVRLFASGSAFDLAEIVQSLTELSGRKALSFGERQTLGRARELLIGELSAVIGKSKEVVERQVDMALGAHAEL